MNDPRQLPLFPPPPPDPASVKWVRDALRGTRRDDDNADDYNPDQFHESGTKEKE